MAVVYCIICAAIAAVVTLALCREQMKTERMAYEKTIDLMDREIKLLDTPIKLEERELKVKKIGCEMYMAMEDLDDPKQAADYIEKTIGSRFGRTIVHFCDIDMRIEPVMMNLIVRARLRVALPEKNCDIYEELMRKAAEYRRSTAIGPEQFAAGNLGALNFVMDAYALNALHAEEGFMKMLSIGVTGDKLYMLWNDCCDRDTILAVAAMNNLSESEILWHINYEGGRGIPFTEEEKEKLRYE